MVLFLPFAYANFDLRVFAIDIDDRLIASRPERYQRSRTIGKGDLDDFFVGAGVAVGYAAGIYFWSHPDRFVQLKWAKSFWLEVSRKQKKAK